MLKKTRIYIQQTICAYYVFVINSRLGTFWQIIFNVAQCQGFWNCYKTHMLYHAVFFISKKLFFIFLDSCHALTNGMPQCTMLKNKYHYRMEAIWERTIGDLGLGCFCHITHCYNVEENTSFASFHLVVWRIGMIGLCVTNVLCSKLDDVSTTAYNLVMCVQGLQLMTWGFVQYYVFIT